MTDLGAVIIGICIWWGLWSLGSALESAADRLQQAVEYVVDNWGMFEGNDDEDEKDEISK